MGFRKWIPRTRWDKFGNENEISKVEEALHDRYIYLNNREDKLRWGMTPRGTFTVQEAYKIKGFLPRIQIVKLRKTYGK